MTDTVPPVTNDSIEAKRLRAADRYPVALEDSMGRKHRNVPREAILRGDWDDGWIVKNA